MRKLPYSLGFTLIEMLVAISIVSVMIMSLVVLFVMSMKIWGYASLELQTAPPAYIITDRINQEVRSACALATAQNSAFPADVDLFIGMPTLDSYGIISPTNGSVFPAYYMKYYTAANPNVSSISPGSAKYLYMQKVSGLPPNDTAYQGDTPHWIADNVQSFQTSIIQESALRIMQSTTTLLTMQPKEWGTTYLVNKQMKYNPGTFVSNPVNTTVYFRYDLNTSATQASP